MKKAAVIIVYLAALAAGQDPIRTAGLGLALGAGPGIGLAGFYNISEKIQIRPCLAFDVVFSDGYRKKVAGGDTVNAYADDLEFTLQGRYYFHPNVFLSGGFTFIRRWLKTEMDIDTALAQGALDLSRAYKVASDGHAVFLANKWVNALSLPVKIGAEFGRRSAMGGYVEAGYLLQLLPWDQTEVLPIETGRAGDVSKYMSGPGHFLFGAGININFGAPEPRETDQGGDRPQAPDPVRNWGVGLALGGGPGMGVAAFHNITEKIQIRPFFGKGFESYRDMRTKTAGGDTLDAMAEVTAFTLQGRYYFHPRLFAAGGLTYSRKALTAYYQIDSTSFKPLETGERVNALSLPFKIGAEIGRNSAMGGYVEMGYLLQVLPWDRTRVFPVEYEGVDYLAKYRRGPNAMLFGIGATLNFRG